MQLWIVVGAKSCSWSVALISRLVRVRCFRDLIGKILVNWVLDGQDLLLSCTAWRSWVRMWDAGCGLLPFPKRFVEVSCRRVLLGCTSRPEAITTMESKVRFDRFQNPSKVLLLLDYRCEVDLLRGESIERSEGERLPSGVVPLWNATNRHCTGEVVGYLCKIMLGNSHSWECRS